MADKPGDRFTDKQGKKFVLGPDPKGGHLRPYAEGKPPGKGCATMILLFIGLFTAAAIGVRVITS